MVPTTRFSTSTPTNLIKTIFHSHMQSPVFWVILDLIKLTTMINNNTYFIFYLKYRHYFWIYVIF